MTLVPASSHRAARTLALVQHLQRAFADRLEGVGGGTRFVPVSWLRDDGRHGGGTRLVAADTLRFDRASINVSGIHYDDLPEKRLMSATALSTIVHPAHPRAPSMHMHISWTEMRDGRGYWRLMADLNPSIADPAATEAFRGALRAAAGPHYDEGAAQGDRYFFIPALDRCRGVAHFYLEGWNTGDAEEDGAFALRFGEAVIATYGGLLEPAWAGAAPSDAERAAQLAYHTLYLFQVLTLDRGTTSGLLVHDQNDVGILGSLPSSVDRALLASWRDRLPEIQRGLLEGLVGALPEGEPSAVDTEAKRRLAAVVREHYRAHPEALALQASGSTIPPTVANHR